MPQPSTEFWEAGCYGSAIVLQPRTAMPLHHIRSDWSPPRMLFSFSSQSDKNPNFLSPWFEVLDLCMDSTFIDSGGVLRWRSARHWGMVPFVCIPPATAFPSCRHPESWFYSAQTIPYWRRRCASASDPDISRPRDESFFRSKSIWTAISNWPRTRQRCKLTHHICINMDASSQLQTCVTY